MRYRTLRDGFEYQIGEKFIKIRNKAIKYSALFQKELIAFKVGGCLVVTPGMISALIFRGHVGLASEYFPTCDCPTEHKRLDGSPFSGEIYGKLMLKVWCDECFHESAMAI
jgi:hypothetical protein